MAGDPSKAAVVFNDVVARYGGRRAVGPINTRWDGPGLVWLTGPNGSGKSTLLRMVAGLKRPSEGTVVWQSGGADLERRDLQHVRTLTNPEIQLYEELTLLENLEFVASMRGLADGADMCRVALADAGLEKRTNDHPNELSSGLRQRLKLTVTWLGDPVFILLDEPSSNLDQWGRDWLFERVRKRAQSALCVVATNQLNEVQGGDDRLDLGEVQRP
jgi:ABC-type multidrug transport system ATPase subunit